MSQPPWTPPTNEGEGDENPSYRGAHSSVGGDAPDASTAPPPADDVWGGPGAPGPWGAGAADPPWTTGAVTPGPDPWAGTTNPWAGDPTDDSGPAYPMPQQTPPLAPASPQPVPAQSGPQPPQGPPPGAGPESPPPSDPPYGAAPDAAPTPAPWTAPPSGTPGYGPPSYGPGGPAAGPAVGEPAFTPGDQGPPPGFTPAFPPQQPPADDGPFRSVRHDAVPPGSAPEGAGPPAGGPAPAPNLTPSHPSPGDVYTPAEAPPTPRPPQPQLPDSMSDVPQYAARLAAAPLPGAAPGAGPDASAPVGPPPQPDPGQGPAPAGWAGGPPPQAGPPPPGQPYPPQFAAQGPGQQGPGQPGQPGPGGQPPAGWPNAGQGPSHAAGGTPPPPAMPRPEDLLVASRPRTLEKPATWGWRGRLSRMSGGMYKPKPSAAEIADRQAKLNAQRGFSRPMTVVVIQPKGGAGKTPTTICVSSALGVRRGGYIVGWDNNETRGTLAVRTTNDDNQRTTAWDLLGRLDEFERSGARVGDLAYYMRAQGEAQFDALVSDDNPGNMAQIGEVEFKRIHRVLQRFYRMIIIDTGNNVRSTNWQAAVDHADQIVVVSTYQRDVGYSGSWVLDHLAQTGRDELARDAITVLTAAEPTVDDTVKGELVKHFSARTRAVVEVPYDPHIAEGGPIRWDELSEGSKRAWTSVAAAITQTLYERDQRQIATEGVRR